MIDRDEHLRFDFRILIFQNRFLTFEPVIASVCRITSDGVSLSSNGVSKKLSDLPRLGYEFIPGLKF